MTWRRGAAHAPVVDVLDLEPDQPRAERDVLVGEPVQDRPGDRAPASTSGTEGKGEHDAMQDYAWFELAYWLMEM